MGYIHSAERSGGAIAEGEDVHDLNDTSLIFLFQNKIFNAIMEEDTQKALKAIFLLDAHLEPYKPRWRDREAKDGKPARLGYRARVKLMKEKYAKMMITHVQDAVIDGKQMQLPVDPDEVNFMKALEWYRLQRVLMEKAGLLPARWLNIDL